jgi:hypothetical protein
LRDIQPRKVRFDDDALGTPVDERGREIDEGIRRHLEVDHAFHASEFFHDRMERIKQLLMRHKYETIPSRIPVFAHVLLELMLDRVIIRREPAAMPAFYAALEKVDRNVVTAYFAHNGLVLRPETVFPRVQLFIQDRFLYRYPDNAMMLYALNVLNQKVGQPVIAKEDEVRLLETINDTDALLDQDELAIFDELRYHA